MATNTLASGTPLHIAFLQEGYRTGRFTPAEVVDSVLARIAERPERNIWITCLTRTELQPYLRALEDRAPDALPLYGIPFAIKDNIDLAGVPTTAGCPEFAYVPERSAFVVERLIAAGAIPIGKTNLDQFATGLVGTRSPYGVCANAFDPDYIAGGSSSGSAVAVACGQVSFALGTDTAGSGRVPASLNNLVGLKPSRGVLSTAGVVPACRTLDCVSVFALDSADAARVYEVAAVFDAADPFARQAPWSPLPELAGGFRYGVPRPAQLEFFGDSGAAQLFDQANAKLRALGGEPVEIDFSPFLEAAKLLYEGPWVAERYAAIEGFLQAQADALHPVTRAIIEGGAAPRAVAAFQAQYRLAELQRAVSPVWRQIDVLLTPTAGTTYTIDQILTDPIKLNSNLGYYTNFMNLLDLAAVAVPTGFQAPGLPFGVTVCAPAGSDRVLLGLADRLHRAAGLALGVSDLPLPAAPPLAADAWMSLAVCGAHMEGLALNPQLTGRGGRLLRRTRTSDRYRLFALPGSPPQRPGLVRSEYGTGIEVEVWALPREQVGSFVEGIPFPLGIGKVELQDGTWVSGFMCEASATEDAEDITALGGWRAYLHCNEA